MRVVGEGVPMTTLERAAIEWWLAHRPRGYSQLEHLNRPGVNCRSRRDRDLALAVAQRVRGMFVELKA